MKKHFAHFAVAFWLFNLSLYWMYVLGPGYYTAAREAGYQWYTCQEWGDDGHLQASDACTEPMPLGPGRHGR